MVLEENLLLLGKKTLNMTNNYDSKKDTLIHIKRVNELLTKFSMNLLHRALVHDQSKLESPEKEIFDEYTPLLKTLKYPSEEYEESKKKLKVALDHHYLMNSHHPEHYTNGINGMNLLDIVEMYCDWVAASERTLDGSIEKSIETNKTRFEMTSQLEEIFKNTTLVL